MDVTAQAECGVRNRQLQPNAGAHKKNFFIFFLMDPLHRGHRRAGRRRPGGWRGRSNRARPNVRDEDFGATPNLFPRDAGGIDGWWVSARRTPSTTWSERDNIGRLLRKTTEVAEAGQHPGRLRRSAASSARPRSAREHRVRRHRDRGPTLLPRGRRQHRRRSAGAAFLPRSTPRAQAVNDVVFSAGAPTYLLKAFDSKTRPAAVGHAAAGSELQAVPTIAGDMGCSSARERRPLTSARRTRRSTRRVGPPSTSPWVRSARSRRCGRSGSARSSTCGASRLRRRGSGGSRCHSRSRGRWRVGGREDEQPRGRVEVARVPTRPPAASCAACSWASTSTRRPYLHAGSVRSAVLRPHLNRVLVVVTLLLGLPAMAVADRVRHGAGRWLGLRLSRALAWGPAACAWRCRAPSASIPRRYVFAPNHRSHLDIPAMFLARPESGFLATSELSRIPLLGSAMRAMDSASIDRRDRRRATAQLGR